jgi:hypothetical protein
MSVSSSPKRSWKELPQILDEAFNLEEIESLCLDLDEEYENLSGDTRAKKSLALVKKLKRRGRLAELVEEIKKKRPHIDLTDIELSTPQLRNSHSQRKIWLIVGMISLAVIVVVSGSWLIRSLTLSECRPPLIQFRVSTSDQADVMVIPDSEYQVTPGEALMIEAIINDQEPGSRSNYVCSEWTSAGNSRVIAAIDCTLQLQAAQNSVNNVVTVQVNQRGCATSYVETLFLHSGK